MMELFALTVFLVFIGLNGGAPIQKPCPSRDGSLTFTGDSEDCQVYYQCSKGQWARLTCPNDRHWDTAINRCNYKEQAKCAGRVSCQAGYRYDVTTNICKDIDECRDPAIHRCAQTCTNYDGGYRCTCRDGYTPNQDGWNCDRVTQCTLQCQNNGNCIIDGNEQRCECTSGFQGDRCQTAKPACNLQCQNGGVCKVEGSQQTCECTFGYKGNLCQTRSLCASLQCLNGGQCQEDGQTIKCVCQPRHAGIICEKECSLQCQNNGRCEFQNQVETCVCADGYTGSLCQQESVCARIPCLNGGRCVEDSSGSAQCQCQSGFDGNFCERKCSLQCGNNGQCEYNNHVETCVCRQGYQGDLCQQEIPQCSLQCENNGVCQFVNGQQKCQCTSSYSGDLCQNRQINNELVHGTVCSRTEECKTGLVCGGNKDGVKKCLCTPITSSYWNDITASCKTVTSLTADIKSTSTETTIDFVWSIHGNGQNFVDKYTLASSPDPTSCGGADKEVNVGRGSTSARITHLTPGVRYTSTLTLTLEDRGDYPLRSTDIVVSDFVWTKPGQPGNIDKVKSTLSIPNTKLVFMPSDGCVVSYKVTVNGQPVGTDTNEASFTNLNANTEYSYSIIAVNGAGKESTQRTGKFTTGDSDVTKKGHGTVCSKTEECKSKLVCAENRNNIKKCLCASITSSYWDDVAASCETVNSLVSGLTKTKTQTTTTISFTWTIKGNGKSSVDKYTISTKSDPAACKVVDTQTHVNKQIHTATVSDLKPGVRYTSIMTLTLNENSDYPMRTIDVELPEVWTDPALPGDVVIDQSNVVVPNIRLVFTPSDGCVVRYHVDIGGQSVKTTTNQITVNGLTANREYTYSIIAYNGNNVASTARIGKIVTQAAASNCDITCENGGKCQVVDGNPQCTCMPGFSGDKCQTRQPCNEYNPCKNNGLCMDDGENFKCKCLFGWDGKTCQNKLTCTGNDIKCENGGTCEDDPVQGAVCKCQSGFIGPLCEVVVDVSGCGCMNGGISKVPEIFDINDVSKHQCACPTGFTGHRCETRGETIRCGVTVGLYNRNEYRLEANPANDKNVYICRRGYVQDVKYCTQPQTRYSSISKNCVSTLASKALVVSRHFYGLLHLNATGRP